MIKRNRHPRNRKPEGSGRPRQLTRPRNLTVRVSEWMSDELRERAGLNDMTVGQYVRRLLVVAMRARRREDKLL